MLVPMFSLYVTIPIADQLGDFFAFGTQENSLGQLITKSIDVLLIFAIIISLFYIIIGGINWITGGGDKAQVEEARNRIINAILGLIIAIAAYATWILIIKGFLGIDIQSGVNLGVN